MSIRHVVASGGSTTGDGITPNPAITLTRANAVAAAGDVVKLGDGTYSNIGINPANSGTGTADAQRIIYEPEAGANVIIQPVSGAVGVSNFSGKSYVTVRNINFISLMPGIINSSSSTVGIVLEGCSFDSDSPSALSDPAHVGVTFTAVALTLKGTRWVVRRCLFLTWYGTDFINFEGSYPLDEYNDYRYCNSGHGLDHNYASYAVIQRNIYSNYWSRAGVIASNSAGEKVGTVVQHNTYWSVGFNGTTQTYGWSQTGDGPGEENKVKTCQSRTIFRDNLVLASQQFPATDNAHHFRAFGQVENYNTSNTFMRNQRFYHNTFYNGEQHIFSATYINTTAMTSDDNRWYNNVMHAKANGSEPDGRYNASFWMQQTGPSASTWMSTWQIKNNMVYNPVKHGTSTSSDLYDPNYPARGGQVGSEVNWTAGLYSFAAFAALFPTRVTGNIVATGSPPFVNANYTAELADRSIIPSWNNFRLTSGAGKNAGRALATATATSSGGIMTVDDAYVFTDGNAGLIEGDRLIITGPLGQRSTQVTSINSATQMGISPSIQVQTGDSVWLEMFGVNPDLGIAAEPVIVDPLSARAAIEQAMQLLQDALVTLP